jgi:hypothetical protein
VSELYASLLMLGVTISLGSVATGLMTNQFGLTTSTAAAGAAGDENSAGIQLSFVFAVTSSPAGCTTYRGVPGGTVLDVTVFDYGSSGFQPTTIVVNGTIYYSSAYPTVLPGGMATYRLPFSPAGTCAHSWGQTVLMTDAGGDIFQFET